MLVPLCKEYTTAAQALSPVEPQIEHRTSSIVDRCMRSAEHGRTGTNRSSRGPHLADRRWSAGVAQDGVVNAVKSGGHVQQAQQCHESPVKKSDQTRSIARIRGAVSALEALCDYALYKSTFTLHYIYINIAVSVECPSYRQTGNAAVDC